jgi:hypothetical protein
MTTTYSISVARQDSGSYVDGSSQGYRVILTISVVSGFTDPGLFRFLVIGPQQESLQAICSPADLADWIYNVVDPASQIVRRSVADLIYPSKDIAVQCTETMLVQLNTLCLEMDRLANDLGPSTTYTIPS